MSTPNCVNRRLHGRPELRVLTDKQARAVKWALAEGAGVRQLARVWGVSEDTIRRIKRGDTYRNVLRETWEDANGKWD